ncbi:SGNH/GDSL hydrolase family protein [Marivirga salinae]|uniref:SGNH/GDSL hydrolase family protein n=1 Tax=Marivirga salinarum TaxID=3059078 RepID=A0AA51R840_9BACT|nr:SGNH/GDSL hydrolase family protein [Marivirga sp. BDSF4-3]WMN10772.1 SGNH/GDSL hydrolase family protein [Marivirga sp. BDSF4-3]
MAQDKLLYLALGDSYTIGEAVDADKTWPKLLSDNLNQRGVKIQLDKIIAKTGWTTDELLVAIEDEESLKNTKFDIVSLLIGVNNQYRGYGIKQYEKEFELLLKKAINLAGNKVSKVFVVSIPDYGVTPFALENNKNSDLIAQELYKYNSIAKNISDEYGVRFFDITPISLKAIWKKDFVAEDKLHPSAKMYADWVEYIEPGVFQLLKD